MSVNILDVTIQQGEWEHLVSLKKKKNWDAVLQLTFMYYYIQSWSSYTEKWIHEWSQIDSVEVHEKGKG